jgi:hypothetical protein
MLVEDDDDTSLWLRTEGSDECFMGSLRVVCCKISGYLLAQIRHATVVDAVIGGSTAISKVEERECLIGLVAKHVSQIFDPDGTVTVKNAPSAGSHWERTSLAYLHLFS